MSKIIYENQYTAYIEILVPTPEYDKHKARIIDDIRKTVSIDGFRPGKVPAALADKELDPMRVANVIRQETVQKFGQEAMQQLQTELKDADRTILNMDVSMEKEDGLGLTDEGYKFRMIAKTIPQVDFSEKTKLEIKKYTEKDLPKDFPKLADVLKERGEGALKMANEMEEEAFKNKKEGEEKKAQIVYSDLADAMENNTIYKMYYQNLDNFNKTLTDNYESEKQGVIDRMKQKDIIEALIDEVPDFELPKDVIDGEVKRITDSVEADAKETGKTLQETLDLAGIPQVIPVVVKNREDVEKLIKAYVDREMKLMWILRFTYEKFVTNKVTEKDIEELAKEMQCNPKGYNVPENLSLESAQDMAFDRLLRAAAFEYIRSIVVEKE
jgi:FKBP-type peptidyl-prolyl cis-trans isomerase (trigger factor)